MKTIRLLSLTVLFACAVVWPTLGQSTGAGNVDLTFNTQAQAGYGPNGAVLAIAPLTNGQVLVAGSFSFFNPASGGAIVRLNANGSPDSSFNLQLRRGTFNSGISIKRLLPRPDGRFYVHGNFNSVNFVLGYTNLALIDADGKHDTNFVPTGLGADITSATLAVEPDNKLLINSLSNFVQRVGANGVVESSFYASNFLTISGMGVHTNGRIYVIGVSSPFPNLRYTVERLNADGSTDTSFVAPTFGSTAGATDAGLSILKVQPDGKPILLGGFSFVGSTQRGGIARLNADGSLDTTFVPGTGGIGTIYQSAGLIGLTDIALLPDGRIVIWRDGVFRYNNAFRYGIARISSTGTLDTGFTSGTGPADAADDPYSDGWGIRTVAAGPNGEIYAGGVFTNFNNTGRKYIVRLNSGPVSSTPTIVTPPQSQSVSNGVDVVFSVVVSGPGPLTYVWKHNTKVIPGATSATLTVSNVQLADVGAYLVTAANSAGSATAAPAVLTVNGVSVPDLSGPTFKITSPAGTFVRSTTNLYTFSGTAQDNLGLASLSYQQDTNPWVQIPLMTNWNFTVDLHPGTNRFRLTIADIANNHSATQNFVAFYVVTQALSLTINGNGTVVGATNGQGFEIGRNYLLKATPKPGNLFSNWVADGLIVTNPSLTFFMWSNSTVTANFVTNPFIALKGVYSGLFYQTNSPAWDSSGFFTLTLGVNGAYSGKLIAGTSSSPLSGAFDLSLASTKRIIRPGKSDLLVSLQLADGSDQINGSVSNVNFLSDLGGYRAPFSTTRPASNYVGKYNLLLSGGANPATSPFGNGFAKISVAAGGVTSIGATLADGAIAVQSVPLGEGGVIPLYMVLYAGKGSIFGWLTLTNSTSNDVSGPLLWTKTNVTTGAFYLSGFTNDVETIGSRYIATNKPVLNFSNAVVLLEGANLDGRTTNDVFLDGINKITVTSTNTNKLVLTLNLASGQVTGTFLNPATGKNSLIKSVLLQNQNSVGGFALGTNQSGLFYFGLPENFPLFQSDP